MAASKITINIENEDQKVDVHTQYGMRYPSGAITWDEERGGGNGDRQITFRLLAQGNETELKDWDYNLRRRAAVAQIDHVNYAANHQLVKRSITVAVTAPEEA